MLSHYEKKIYTVLSEFIEKNVYHVQMQKNTWGVSTALCWMNLLLFHTSNSGANLSNKTIRPIGAPLNTEPCRRNDVIWQDSF